MPESLLLNTGCVPDYVYMIALVVIGGVALWLRRRERSRRWTAEPM